MPAAIIKNFSKKSGKSEKEVEDLWKKAKSLAAKGGRKDDFAYITGILKKMLKIEEYLKLKGFLLEKMSGNDIKKKNVITIDKNVIYIRDHKDSWLLIQGSDQPEMIKTDKEMIKHLNSLKNSKIELKETSVTGDIAKTDPPLDIFVRRPDRTGPRGYDAFDIDDSQVFARALRGKRKGTWWKNYLKDSGIAAWIHQNRLKPFHIHYNGIFVRVK